MFRAAGRLSSIGKQSLKTQSRNLNLQEFQSKELLSKHGCSVQNFVVASNRKEAEQKWQSFGDHEYVVKAQILAGGRGKGHFKGGKKGFGGVYITMEKDKALQAIDDMIGKRLVTKQTTEEGVRVDKVMIAEGVAIARETYLAVLMDRESNGPVVVASPAGGMEIEAVAEKTPDLIFKEPIDIEKGMSEEQAKKIARNLNFRETLVDKAAEEIKRLYKLFINVDATQVEINPFVETKDGRVFCVDAKMNFDDSAAFRQKEVFSLENFEEQDAREVEAHKFHLNYIGMDGNIACLVNGAGLAMATMDLIKLHGGEPANFLDVGGAVTEDAVFNAVRIITSDPKVKCVLVNIFGGIVNCATIANGVVGAIKKIGLNVPLVVRLEGTNVDEAKRIMKDSGLPILTASCLDEAATKAVESLA
ncbi:unnamed protein product [Caenorhabditis auriculariae]|uniref:Succinate--CoA ligase [GDP-forming] subunit beta, mitochondrial n=1 Tax=Caenorhabditis auriculariae TaxID=2777116 RepID=A0A8S1HTY8_9PELO|nr:unnamed protein product [Caenorhabditis auriculariae]